MATQLGGTGRFDIGHVISRTFTQIGENWQVYLPFMLAVHVVSAVFNWLFMSQVIAKVTPGDPGAALAMFASPVYWADVAVTVIVSAFAQSGMTGGMLTTDKGSTASFGDCVSSGLRFILPTIGLTLLWSLAVTVGLVLLAVPGLILITMWSAAVPAMIGEGTSLMGAFGRSRALTKGHRWPVFATLVVMTILAYIAILALQGFSTSGFLLLMKSNALLAAILSSVSGVLSGLLLNSVQVAIYRELISAKEGGGQAALAEVFA